MAWMFSLSVECASSEGADTMARFLDGKVVIGARLRAREDGHWAIAVPSDVDALDVYRVVELNIVGNFMYAFPTYGIAGRITLANLR